MSKNSKKSSKNTDSYRRRKPEQLFQAAGPVGSSQPAAQRTEYLVQLGIEAIQSRRIEDAEGYLSNAIALAPQHALANNCMGLVRRAQGRLAEAIACYEQSLTTDPNYSEAYNNLGVALEAIGDLPSATAAYEAALRSKPGFAAAQNNLGSVLTKLGRAEDAVAYLRKAVAISPQLVAAHNNLGLALSHLAKPREAEEAFRKALALQPAFSEGYVNLGNLLRAGGQLDAAAECYRTAIRHHPQFAAAHVGLGNVLYDQKQPSAALTEYELAIQLRPQFAEAHFGLGNAYSGLENDSQAEASWKQALQLRPGYAEAHNNLGAMYQRQGQVVLAENEYKSAIESKPDLIAAHTNLGNLYREQDRIDLVFQSYKEALKRQPDRPLNKLRLSTLCQAVWTDRDESNAYTEHAQAEWNSLRGAHPYQDLPDLLSVANEPPYNLQFLGGNIRPLKEAYANIFRYTGPTFHARPRSGRIKLGMVVTANHEVAFLRLIWRTLKQLNNDEFERTILCSSRGAILLRAAIREHEARIVELPDQPHKVLHAIREQQLELLHYFEICTDSLNYFLPFFRLAPVQVTSWGIQVTSGISNVDAYLSSDLVESEDAQEHYTEKLCRAKTLLTYQTQVTPSQNGKTRASFGFTADQHLYFCVQHLGKFHPDFDALLAEILRQDSRGVIVATQDKHGYGMQRLKQRFARTMPDVMNRIVFLPRQEFDDYISLVAACDVMLDPIHFSGVTTTYDSFSLSKPIVIWPSQYHRGRYTLGCYRRMGVTDCVAHSAEEYVEIAVRLGTDRVWREEVSGRIRDARHRIFEDQQAVSEHERIFRELVERSRQE